MARRFEVAIGVDMLRDDNEGVEQWRWGSNPRKTKTMKSSAGSYDCDGPTRLGRQKRE